MQGLLLDRPWTVAISAYDEEPDKKSKQWFYRLATAEPISL